MRGSIVRKVEEKGYGFILGEDEKDYFFHISRVQYCSWDELDEGEVVEFKTKKIKGKIKCKEHY